MQFQVKLSLKRSFANINIQSYEDIWIQFQKWAQSQADQDKIILVPNFMQIQYKQQKNLEFGQNKYLQIQLNDNFLFQNNMKFNSTQDLKFSSLKVNYTQFAKTSNTDKDIAFQGIQEIFAEIQDLLSNNTDLELDLRQFGKLIMKNRLLSHQPNIKKQFKDQINQKQKQSAQSMLYLSRSFKNQKLDSLSESSQMDSQIIANDLPLIQRLKQATSKFCPNPTRKNKEFHSQLLSSEMLGAGTDPLARDQSFSKLSNEPYLLFNSQFQKPGFAKIRYPPILDSFSRTLASPLCTQKYNLSECARIASNYTKSAQSLYIDLQLKHIKVAKIMESKVQFTANNEILQPTADKQQELQFITNHKKLTLSQIRALKQKVNQKKLCYDRFMAYVDNEIGLDQIAPIRQYWITDILEIIPSDFPHMKRDKVEKMIDQMLTEINKFYYQSVKQSILEYVLKDQNERLRIGITQILNQNFRDYGEDYFDGIEPAQSWRNFVSTSKENIKQILVIYKKVTLDLTNIWQKYESMLFLQLPTHQDQPVNINQFIKLQDDRIQEVKLSLQQVWSKEVYKVYQNELILLTKNKKQAYLYFEANAAFMSNQIRYLIFQSLEKLKYFFIRFKKPSYKNPLEIVSMESDLENIKIEDVFLTVKLQDNEEKIVFETSLETIKQKLLNIIETSQNFQRPEQNQSKSDKQFIWSIQIEDFFIQDIYNQIEIIIDDNIKVVQDVLEIYNQYAYLLIESEKVLKFILQPNNTIKNYQTQIQKYKLLYTQVNKMVPFSVRMNMIEVNGLEVKQKLLETCENLEQTLVKAINKFVLKRIADLSKEIGDLFQGVQSKAESAEKLVEIERNIEKIRVSEFKKIQFEFSDTCKWLFELYNNNFNCEEELKLIYQLSNSVHSFIGKIDHEEVRVKRDREDLENKLRKKKEEFSQSIDAVCLQIDQLKNEYTDNFHQKEANPAIDALNKKIQGYVDEMIDINEKEELIGWQPTEFPKLIDAQKNIKPYQLLWQLIRDFQVNSSSWTKDKIIFKLDPDEIDSEIKNMYSSSQKLISFFPKTNPTCHKLVNEVGKDIIEFQKNIPLIKIMCNPGLKDRHWEEISQIVGIQINPEKKDNQMTLKNALSYELNKFIDQIDIINDTATREFAIEQIMNKQQHEWENVFANIKLWRESGTYIVSGSSIEEIHSLLDDQIAKTQAMKGSPYAKIFEQKILEWEEWLIYTFNLTNTWKSVQQVWVYLEPIFSSPDIIKYLPVEAAKFKEVDVNWRSIMSKINQTPQVLEFTKNRKLLDLLKESQANLEISQKGLYSYMEDKRTSFPRFYFLSNDELLEILSETKDAEKVQPHLIKCFEGIKKLQFDEQKRILGMFSTQQEFIDFQPYIETETAKGQVDIWLIQVEKSMQQSIQTHIKQAFDEYSKMKRNDWVLDRCGMAVLCINMTYWTINAEEFMQNFGAKGATDYGRICNKELQLIVKLVRDKISNLNRCTLEAMIVLDVHNRDVMFNIGKENIEKITDFSWQSQLRYYYIDNKTKIRIINAELSFNYEYLGNSSRLVITPLTDRCYRTLCGALYLNYGGAPEGPAGTGKTETVKDLAKALARHCVVFNCSDGLDFKAMGKFFKGLAQSGSWTCFDEFNRIDLEVLSVVAQQVQCIQIARAKGEPSFIFEGQRINLITSCNVFITMNPGYAGRSELPDNLKVLFRSVAMMVPDYVMISEISLYSYGFSDASNLARKIVTTYKLCSEQLSSQSHYDYGMRAVKAVLVAAGNIKRKYPEDDESILTLKSINSINLAKFLAFDTPLFIGITNDLFPGITIPPPDYQSFLECIQNQMAKKKLTETQYLIEKIIQLYEMINVRHGIMIVGLPFSSKTTIINVLASCIEELSEKKLMDEQNIQVIRLNPKSISIKYLYGYADESTNEWTDGLLAVKFRQQARQENDERKWLIFDGPVDAIWVENMNTVLDDNKKLCLNSGEIIQMNKTQNVIFEAADLLVASPATVSRCGMVYMEPFQIGWSPYFKSWLKTLQEQLKADDLEEIEMLFYWVIDPILKNLRDNFIEISPTQDQNLVYCLIKMYGTYIKEFYNEIFLAQDIKIRHTVIDSYFIMSLVWTLGATVIVEYRKSFDLFIKKLFALDIKFPDIKTKKIYIPDRGQIYDYKYITKQGGTDGQWINWNDLIDKTEIISEKLMPSEVIVKSIDTMRYQYLIQQNILSQMPTLICGQTGTGKTIYIKNVIINQLPSNFISIQIGFSAQTSSQQTQEFIDGKLDRRKKWVFGPKIGSSLGKAALFIDDLNMPQKEEWGAQPPIELLRQLLDEGGWYDNKDKDKNWKTLQDIHFISAMGPPGGGRSFISQRLLRQLHLIALVNFDDDVMIKIFSTILQWYFLKGKFNTDISKQENKVVTGTLDVYKFAYKELLPTPLKSHYLFNLRDFSRVIIGICLTDCTTLVTQEQVVKIWVHELMRVFSDRLVNDQDKTLLLEVIKETVKNRFGLNFDTVFQYLDSRDDEGLKDGTIDLFELRVLMWTDVLNPIGILYRKYEECIDQKRLAQVSQQILDQYNNHNTDKKMDLSMFNFAIEHLLIISRLLKLPGGNGMLVGMGGSGRHSLTKLAAFSQEYHVIQIEITKTYSLNEWHDDMKKILVYAGGKNQPTVFLFSDTQIKNETFVEDINNLLNTGEIPNLFNHEEKQEIYEMISQQLRNIGKNQEMSNQQIQTIFNDQVKRNLHVVLCFSPIGEMFRTRVRMFPNLINCCTIDWFTDWPENALEAVSRKFLVDIEMDFNLKFNCALVLQYFHASSQKFAKEFQEKLDRQYYITSPSYLEMLNSFKSLLENKKKELQNQIDKYTNGHYKIISTEKQIEIMKKDLIDLQPQLIQAKVETEKKINIVSKEKQTADYLKAQISREEEIVFQAVNEANIIKDDCQKDLEEVLPALAAAEQALLVLEPKDINTLKGMSNPPAAIKAICRACVILLLKPNDIQKKKNDMTSKLEIEWWETCKAVLNDPTFINIRLFKFDKENVNEKAIKDLGEYMKTDEGQQYLTLQAAQTASQACICLYKWTMAIYQFYFVNKKVLPKKKQLQEAEDKAEKLKKQLQIKQKELQIIVDKVNNLNEDLNISTQNKNYLESKYNECNLQLKRAEILIDNLAGEKQRWGQLSEQLTSSMIQITGDVMLSAGLIGYLGPFTVTFREQILQDWLQKCEEMQIPFTHNYNLIKIIGDPVKIRKWNMDGLPTDNFSLENAIILFNSRRWPLIIDPQNQANKWIKKFDQTKKLEIIKLTDQNILRTLENAIQFGRPVLLENIYEVLDPGLNPILQNQTYQKGNQIFLKLGDQDIEYSRDFSFYITTKLRNPHYLPEIQTKVTLINFMITYEGLNDQLLGFIVKQEKPELENEKERLIIETAENKKSLYEIEQQILDVLAHAENILQDEHGIQVLQMSKSKAKEISEKQEIAETTEKQIDAARSLYQPLSQEVSFIFFAISDLGYIDPMYQYSLSYYIELFNFSILNSEQSENVEDRIKYLKDYFLYFLYKNICRSLFEKDKLMFSFLLASRLLIFQKKLNDAVLKFLLTGGISIDQFYPNIPQQAQPWLPKLCWEQLNRLSQFEEFEGLLVNFENKVEQWEIIFSSQNPQLEQIPLQNLTEFQKLLILRCIRIDKMIPCVTIFVQQQLGVKFTEPPTFDLESIFQDSNYYTPLIFVLSPGSDPFASLQILSTQLQKEISQISLGQGQGPNAQALINQCMKDGSWAVLQNCHLCVSWMPVLEKICEEIKDNEKINKEFRLWLTSYPSSAFPTTILQNSVKMTNEPPQGLKSNIIGSYLKDPIINQEFFEGCSQPEAFKKLLYGLCFFHAVIQERRKFGPVGWNIPYEFNESDLRICVRQLKMFLDEDTTQIDYKAIVYLAGECNYGGRVTDDKDRRLIMTLLQDYYTEELVIQDKYKFCNDDSYKYPQQASSHEQFLEFFKQMPHITNPEIFGFHYNADITKDIGESNQLFETLLLCGGSVGSDSNNSQEHDFLKSLVQGILNGFPQEFDVIKVNNQYPTVYTESMNTVLNQEIKRFNVLLHLINSSLKELDKALKGFIVISQQLEIASKQLNDGKIPSIWISKSYVSNKSVVSYIKDLKQRIIWFNKWIVNGQPEIFWISAFFFTHSFTTGVLQNYARNQQIAIDLLTFNFDIIDFDITEAPVKGAYIDGLYIEAARWNIEKKIIDESLPKILFSQLPIIQLVPCKIEDEKQFQSYDAPIYKTCTRKGVLATTGHNSNFVMFMKLASEKLPSHWIKRGVALFTQLDD